MRSLSFRMPNEVTANILNPDRFPVALERLQNVILTLQLHNHFSIGMGGMNRRLYSDTFEDFHTSPLIINKIEHCVKSDNSLLNTVSYRIIKTLGHSSHPDFATTRLIGDKMKRYNVCLKLQQLG